MNHSPHLAKHLYHYSIRYNSLIINLLISLIIHTIGLYIDLILDKKYTVQTVSMMHSFTHTAHDIHFHSTHITHHMDYRLNSINRIHWYSHMSYKHRFTQIMIIHFIDIFINSHTLITHNYKDLNRVEHLLPFHVGPVLLHGGKLSPWSHFNKTGPGIAEAFPNGISHKQKTGHG